MDLEQFQKMDLRIGKIVRAEKITGSRKLLKLIVDIGEEERQIVAGLSEFYQPEEIINREVVVITNLEPRVILGIESQGMILAANSQGPVLLKPDEEVPPGTKIR